MAAPLLTAPEFIRQLKAHQSDVELEKIKKYFKTGKDQFMGVRMGTVFALAKKFKAMEPREIVKALRHSIHEVRAGAVSIMDFQARDKKTTDKRRKELYDLYLNNHDTINNWDLIDRSAPYVIGGYLIDKPRKVLYKLARSKNMWERRTSIVATYFFIRQNQTDDTFAIAELLLFDKEDLVHKAAGSWLRTAGLKNKRGLLEFLDAHAATMPRTMLRYALEKLDAKSKKHYMALGQQ